MESLYKSIGMDVLPDEYLPDDYNGPRSGSLQQMIRTYSQSHCANDCLGAPLSCRPHYAFHSVGPTSVHLLRVCS